MTIRHMLNQLRNSHTTIEQCEVIGRNLWQIGLRVQEQRKRVERELKEMSERRRKSLQKTLRRGSVRRETKWKRSES